MDGGDTILFFCQILKAIGMRRKNKKLPFECEKKKLVVVFKNS